MNQKTMLEKVKYILFKRAHKDPLHFTETDWDAVVELMPERVHRAFTLARQRSAFRAKRLLAAYDDKRGGLTTYDPDSVSGVCISEAGLEQLGDLLERADLEARIRRFGVVEGHRQIAELDGDNDEQ